MRHFNHKRYVYFIGMFLLASIVGLWSWNTLSELFDLPQAQYKHVVAALFLLIILRLGFFLGHRRTSRPT